MATPFVFLLIISLASAAPDWTDCPNPCRCKWISGKKTAYCQKQGLVAVPTNLDEGMQVLELSGNSIPTLPRAVFQSAGLIHLQRIYLSESGIYEIDQDAFKDLIILVEVDLSNNEITTLHPRTFYGNERLRVLYLNGNPLGKLVKAQFPPLPFLRTLELESCRLQVIDQDAFVHVAELETLNLRYNLLKNLSEAAFMNFGNLKTLLLEGNPWRCDCELRVFRDWFLASKLTSASLTCAKPDSLRGRRWKDVNSQEFACAPRVFAYPQREVQAEAGGNVSFGCHVLGDPEPQVFWLYEGYPVNHTWLIIEAEEGLLDKWSNISIYNVSEVDAGLYTCVARNVLDVSSVNVTLVLPEVVTATTLSKTDSKAVWWGVLITSVVVVLTTVITITTVCCVRRNKSARRRDMQESVSFTDQEKKLLDVSIATTTDRGTGSTEAIGPDLEIVEPPVHITIERDPLPMVVFPPPPEFSTSTLPAGAYGNIFISVSVSRDPGTVDASRCPDLLDLPHRSKPVYHGMATLPRRPCPAPHYDNMGPRVTAGGSSTLSLPDATVEPPTPHQQQTLCVPLTPEFVSL